MRMKQVLSLAAALLLGAMGCCPAGTKAEETTSLWVDKVENLPEDFIMGMDASSVIAEEESGVRYYNFDGEEQDVFQTLAENGITHIRVRVWNNPYDAQGRGYGGGNNDIDKAVAIGKRAVRYGLRLIVDFHYSDFWADPSKQMVPLAWKNMYLEQKAEALYSFTAESLEKLKAAGVQVSMVQLGNETNGVLCGERDWSAIAALMKAGGRAVRACCPDALIAVHFGNPEQPGGHAGYAKELHDNGVDYDVFASSYYPFWHGTLENLKNVLTDISETYGKKVMVMETSYAYTPADTDFSDNSVSEGNGLAKNYPYTVQGQATEIRDVIDTVAHIPGGIGVAYWEGTWITVGGKTREENNALWEKYGSGWASRFAAVYDPNDAGKYYGGCAVDNQALFDEKGRPLPSLQVFRLVRTGSGALGNLLVNESFEDGDRGWTAVNLGKTEELYVEDKVSDSLKGTKHFHFWSAEKNSVEFTLEQTVETVPAGTYCFTVSIMGGDAGESDIYAYVLLDGERAGAAPLRITSFDSWDTAAVEHIAIAEGQTVTVGVYVKCAGEGGGAWGKIDNASLIHE